MLKAFDEKFGKSAKRKKTIYIDLSGGTVSSKTLKLIGFKKLFDKTIKHNVKEYQPKNKKEK